MYIGQVAKLTGATPKAIRHYEAIGLLAPPKRLGKYRYFSDADIEVIRLIRHAQKYGFKLSELESIVRTTKSGEFPYGEITEAIENKRRKIHREITQLRTIDKGLVELLDQVKNNTCSC